MAIGTGLAMLVGGGLSAAATSNAAGKQEDAANAQLQLGRDQMALQKEVYDKEMGILGDTRNMNVNAAQNTFAQTFGAQRNLLDFGNRNARDMYNRNGNIAENTFERQRGQFTQARNANLAGYRPYAESGDRARGLRDYEMGLSSSLPSGVNALALSPAARFALEQGRDSVEAGAVSGGSARSGATIAALEKLRMGMAAQDRETQLDRLMGITDQGLAARGAMAGVRDTYAGNMSNITGDYGNARLANSTALGGQLQALRQQYTGNMQDLRLGRLDTITNARNNYAAGVGNAGNNFSQGSQGATQFQANALANLGDAGASRSAGIANAFTGTLNNYLAARQYGQLTNQQPAAQTNPNAWTLY